MLKGLLALSFFLFSTIVGTAEPLRIYVLYGQGSIATSPGMFLLAKQIRKLDPQFTVTTHNWKNYADVVNSIRKLSVDKKVVIVGYSLGANATTWIPNAIPDRPIELAVGYDPSIWSAVYLLTPNVKRYLLYHNTGYGPFGHAYVLGPQVEITETSMPHLAIDFSKKLHSITIAAIKQAAK